MFPTRRAFLFLQGPKSFFFHQLGQRLIDDGHKVVKVNFNLGDQCYWHLDGAHVFRDPWPLLGDFIAELWKRYEITDQVALDDCRPAHRDILRAARRRGIRNHVFADGYFQPHWVTLEREGVDGHSLLPRDPVWYHEIASLIPHALPARPFAAAATQRAISEFGYTLAEWTSPVLFRRTYKQLDMPRGFAFGGHAKRAWPLESGHRDERYRQLMRHGYPFYLLPLQAETDTRIRHHSPFADIKELLETVVTSFANLAPRRTRLVILDPPAPGNRGVNARFLRELERRFALHDRLVHLDARHLDTLIDHASGMVTVNGSEGTTALERGCPTLALGNAPYRLPGLTSLTSLDDFWIHPMGPDARLVRHYAKAVIYATQVNGGFYGRKGRDLAVVNAVHHLTSNVSPLERLLCGSRLPVAS